MSFEVSGKLVVIDDIQEISAKFRKREFVIEIKDNSGSFEFIDYVKFQLTQDKCSLIESMKINDEIKVNFNLRGRKWEKDGKVSYFTNLEAWKIEPVQNSAASPQGSDPGFPQIDDAPVSGNDNQASSVEGYDDLPF